MSIHYDPQRTINGTYGTVIVNGMEVMNFDSCTIELELETAEVNQPRNLVTGYKMIGIGGTGEITVNRLDHEYIRIWAQMLMRGVHPELTILVTVDDPASVDSMTVALKDVVMENLPLMSLEPKTIVQDTYKFKFGTLEFPQ